MANTLFLCEKPAQGRDIARNLNCHKKGEGFLSNQITAVTWCFGHLLATAPPDHYCENIKPWRMEILPIVPESWDMVVTERAKKQFSTIKALLKEAKTVVIATDADREGEVIAREVLHKCKFKGEIKRLWISALDDASIQKALNEIREGHTTENLYQAGLGRQRADWLIGMNMTMAASVIYGKYGEGVLSVGRVQTPTLKLVVDRDEIIENFKPKDYFEFIAQFTTADKKAFFAKWQPSARECDAEGYCTDINLLNTFVNKIKGANGIIEKFEDKQKQQPAPLCLSLSQLQKIASAKFGLSAQRTLEVSQSLYETHKATTYPRTDCGYLPKSQFNDAAIILKNLKKINPELSDVIEDCDIKFQSPTWNDEKITAHHGMMPTLNENVNLNKMQDEEKKIYDIICRHYISQFLGNYEYAQRSMTVLCTGETFKASSATPLKQGWKNAFRNSIEKDSDELDKTEEDDDHLSTIPDLKINESVKNTDEKIISKKTKPPGRYTEGTLIEAMKLIGRQLQDAKLKSILKETSGIGTEATRANIIATLFKRNYFEKKGKQIYATPRGRQLISQLPSMVCDPLLTAQWEQSLDYVAQGQLKLDSFLHQQKEILHQMVTAIKPLTIDKTSGGRTTTPYLGKSNEEGGVKSEERKKQKDRPMTSIHQCEACQKPLVRRQSKKDQKYFWGCKGYPTCRFTAEDENYQPKFKAVAG